MATSKQPVKKNAVKKPIEEEPKTLWEKTKKKVHDMKEDVVETFRDDPKAIMPVLSGAFAIILGVVKIVSGCMPDPDACRVPDDMTGLDYMCTHPLTNSEIMDLGSRMSNGETTGEALSNMGVLKEEKRRK